MAQQAPAYLEGRSIHVGIDRVDDDLYQGALPELSAASLDAIAMRGVADAMGCASRLLLNEDATLGAVTDALASTIERLVPGDFLMVTFAGHMTTLAGAGDDPDGWDEAWCLHDGILMDDEFHDLLSEAPEGSEILIVTDSCFAQGMVDAVGAPLAGIMLGPHAAGGGPPPPGGAFLNRKQPVVMGRPSRTLEEILGGLDVLIPRTPAARLGDLGIARLVRQGLLPRSQARPSWQRRSIAASVIALAAAAEGSLAFEGPKQGLFTAALLSALEESDGTLSYVELLDRVAELMQVQTPSAGTFGQGSPKVLAASAFAPTAAEPRHP